MINTIHTSKVSPRHLFLGGIAFMAIVFVGTPLLTHAQSVLYRQLEVGSTGSDVSALQTFLAQDPTIYPQGLVTNYFGTMTKTAVANFQTRNNIPAVGRVGPVTLGFINTQMVNRTLIGGVDDSAPIISNVRTSTNNDSATVSWTTNEAARGVLYYSATPFVMYEQGSSVYVSGSTAMMDNTLRYSQSVTVSGLQKNTTYYYLVYSTDASGNVNITWPTTFLTTY